MIFLKRYKNHVSKQYQTCDVLFMKNHLYTIINDLWIHYIVNLGKPNVFNIDTSYHNKITNGSIIIDRDIFNNRQHIGNRFSRFNKLFTINKTTENGQIIYWYLMIYHVSILASGSFMYPQYTKNLLRDRNLEPRNVVLHKIHNRRCIII
jgi:hypothetical protein